MSEKNPWFEPGEPARPTDIKSDKADLDMRLERKALAEGWDRTADKLDAAQSQLAALREELAKHENVIGAGNAAQNFQDVLRLSGEVQVTQQRLADAERRNAELLSLLTDHQWEWEPYDSHGPRAGGWYCVQCGESSKGSHSDGCRIYAALTKPEEAKS